MKRKMKAGSTSQSIPIFIQDTSSTTGAGLGSLVYNSSGLAAKYRRQGQSSWTTITLATMTLGTWASGGFVTDGGPVTGTYEIGLPDAVLASETGVTWVEVFVYGATNALPVLIEIELDAVDYQTDAMGALKPTTAGRTLDVSAAGNAGIDWSNLEAPTTTVNLSGTTIKTATDVETDTQDIQSRIPAALTGDGNIKADTLRVSGTTQTAKDLGALEVTNINTLAGHDPGATLGTSTLTQAQVTGGAYALNSASFAFNAALDFTTTQKASTLARVTLVDTTTTASALTTNNDKTGYALSSAGVQAIWDALSSALTTVGSIGKRIVDYLTGDVFARVGAPAGASIAADIAQVKADTAATLIDTNELQTDWANGGRLDLILDARAATTDFVTYGLDHLVYTAVVGADIADNSIIAKLASKSATADWDTFNNTTDSHEALRDNYTTGGDTFILAPQASHVPLNEITPSGTVTAYRYCPLPIGPIGIFDANNDPVDLSGNDLLAICIHTDYPDRTFQLTSGAGELVAGGADSNEVTVYYTPSVFGLYQRHMFRKVNSVWRPIEIGFWNIQDGPNPGN